MSKGRFLRRLILCSDDFAFSRDISTTIAGLAQEGKLNAIGCMAVMPGWPNDVALLRDLPDHVQIGLHLTLTDERPLTKMAHLAPDDRMPAINDLARRARFGTLPLDEIAREVSWQFSAFIDRLGRPPAFVDGHQHAHALRGIRDIVLKTTARRAPGAWIRCCADTIPAMMARPFRAKALGSAIHSLGLRRDAARYGLRCNDSFAGHYDFSGDYETLFPRFLRAAGPVHLVMCHPGGGARAGDGIATARTREAMALRSWSIADMATARGLAFPA